MPRIQTSAVRTQVLATAQHDELRVASGSNNLISRTEQAVLGADLHEAAEEARRRNPGKAPTVGAVLDVVAERVDAAIASVNQASGSGKAWVSKVEIENLAARDPLMGARIQRAVDVLTTPVTPPPTRLSSIDVENQLKAHTGSMFFDGLLGSEGGELIDVVRIATRIPTPPTASALARALGHDPTTDAGFVERFKAVEPSLLNELQQSNGDTPDAKKVIELLKGLTDLRLLIVGKDGASDANHPTYIVGTAADDQLVGIKTGVIWT